MRFDPAHLETLVAITEEGTFDAAARRLHVTASAVSQRVRALEQAAGQVLVRRTTPATVTPAGEPLRANATEPHAPDLGGWVFQRAATVRADHALSSTNDSAISCTCSGVRCGQ